MKLVIAEKPMLARDIARAMCGVEVSESARLPISGNGWTVIGCAGHLLRLKEPNEINDYWAKWSEQTLPIVVDDWPKIAIEDKKPLIEEIRKLVVKANMVVNAGDPDDEGQLIVDELLDYLGYRGEVKRVFVNDNIEKNIVKAFDNLVDNDRCIKAGKSAYARQMADMCFGINETRLATMRLGKLLSIGRVQTPTLGLVVNRDKQIEGHEKRKYFDILLAGVINAKSDGKNKNFDVLLKFKPAESILSEEKHIFDSLVVKEVKEALESKQTLLTAKRSNKIENPPLPYNLTTLQSDMNKKYGYTAKQTLDITQILRDKYKAITYNRSDSQYLKEEHYDQAKEVLGLACNNVGLNWALNFKLKSKAFNEKNVAAHHAIIPQSVKLDVLAMSQEDKNVYESIVKRYALQFLAPAEYKICKLQYKFDSGVLEQELRKVKNRGYKEVVKEIDNNCIDCLPDDGEYYVANPKCIVNEKETTPPKRYTEGTLIADMASIAKYVKDPKIKEILRLKDDAKKGENGGIGTTATRAAIIENLKKRDYLTEKNGHIESTKLAREFYALLPDSIKGADVTAKWWLIQQEIADGSKDVNAIMHDVREVFNQHKDSAYKGDGVAGIGRVEVGKCPKCGQKVQKVSDTFYSCSSNKSEKQEDGSYKRTDGCGFFLSSYCGKKLTEAQVKKLLQNKEIHLTGCISKRTRKTFNVYLSLNQEGVLSPRFENKRKSR